MEHLDIFWRRDYIGTASSSARNCLWLAKGIQPMQRGASDTSRKHEVFAPEQGRA